MGTELRHVNVISPTETNDLQRQETIISYDADSLVDAKKASIRVFRKLRTVSIRPSVQFPTEPIFQIQQCFGKMSSSTSGSDGVSLPKSDVVSALPASTVQSSVMTHDAETELYNVDDIGQFGTRATVRPLGELVALPVPEKRRENLCFDEVLVVSVQKASNDCAVADEEPRMRENKIFQQLLCPDELRHLGGMTIRINTPYGRAATSIIPNAIDPYNIYVSSTFSNAIGDGSGVVSSIQATVDSSFTLIKERRTEALCSRILKEELYLNVKPNKDRDAFDVQCARTTGSQCKRRTGRLRVAQVPNFIPDGSGFLLLRYMVLQQFIGKLETYGMYVTGELCRSTYCFSRKVNVLVNTRLCTVVKVRRCIWRTEYVPDVSVSLYLETGHLVRHTWQGCPYVVHVNPLQDIAQLLGSVPIVYSTIDERWRENVELWEQYLEMRNDRMVDLRSYVRCSGQVSALLRDYVYCLLRTKPRNVLEFTVKHFCGVDVECEYTVVHEGEE